MRDAFPVVKNYRPASQPSSTWPIGLVELAVLLDRLENTPLIERLTAYRPVGRRGYSLRALWRAYLCTFFLNLPHTNALIRELQNNSDLRQLCGFGELPHRTTFNRFIQRLSRHADLVEKVFVDVTTELATLLPDMGRELAIDSTTIRSHSNYNRKHISDPEASWTAKTSAKARDGDKEWLWGYKLHMVADANYGLPLGCLVTTASRNDSPVLPKLLEYTQLLHRWLQPLAVMADRGYDAKSNHQYLCDRNILPIIHIKRKANGALYDGIYTEQGVPTCIGRVPMRYIKSDLQKGHLYRCVGCHLAESNLGGVRYCDTEYWQDPRENIRLFGAIRRDGPEWREFYAKRQAIERVFKSLKESRRLERHCIRGLRQVTLHALMSVLTFQATVLARLLDGVTDEMRWMVRRIA